MVNDTLDELISRCKKVVEEEDEEFVEEYMNTDDPSILHFLIARRRRHVQAIARRFDDASHRWTRDNGCGVDMDDVFARQAPGGQGQGV